jgi:uncharacterized membrane protein YoaK (UPF0700 family)
VAEPLRTAVTTTAGPEGAGDNGAFGLALLLAALAGWVDAAGLAGSGGIFISFMSGNSTGFAVSLAHRDWLTAGVIGATLAFFVTGVMAGETLEQRAGRRGPPLVLGLEALFLAAGATFHAGLLGITGRVTICPLVFAMGLQNATMHRAGGINIGLTYVTGTLVQIGRTLASMLRGEGGARRLSQYLALWSSLVTGAGLGAIVQSVSPAAALSSAAAAAGVLAVMTAQSGSAQSGSAQS